MALTDELILQTQKAFRQLDALQSRLDRISDVRIDVTADTSTLNQDLARTQGLVDNTEDAFRGVNEQITLTTDEYKQVVRAMEEGESASRAIEVATGRVSDEAGSVDDAFRRVAEAMGVSETQARELAGEVGRSTAEASQLDEDLRRVARAMGLSEEEAKRFAAAARTGATNTAAATTAGEGLAAVWARIRGVIIAAVAAFGVRGLVRGFKGAIDASTDLGESFNAIRVTFEEGADAVETFAQTAAQTAGLAASQAQQLVVPIGSLLRNFGFEARDAGEAAVELTQRAADMASVFNTDVSEALGAISAALRGESDPIERFGASITAARVEAFALSEGMAATKSEITDAIKVQARYGLILADTARVQGDFVATADDAANAQRTLAAEFENVRAELGDALMPAFQALLELAPRLVPEMRAVGESMRILAGNAAEAATESTGLFDILAGAPRNFGFLTDLASFPLDFTGALAEIAVGLVDVGSGGDSLAAGIEQLEASFGGLIDSFQQRTIIESFVQDLKNGVDPALAFANATAATARNNVLTRDSFDALARISGVSADRLVDATRAMLEQGEAAGFDADEIKVLEAALLDAREAAGEITPEIDKMQRFRLTRSVTEIARFSDAFETAAEHAAALEGAVDTLEGVAAQSGTSLAVVAENAARFGTEVEQLVADVGAGAVINEGYARSFRDLALATSLDFGDAVDEFDLLIETTNEAGDTVPATMEQMLTDLSQQADNFARLEAATTILEALGFDSLASDLRQKGPDAAAAAEEFVNDLAAAATAESLFDEGGEISDELLAGVRDALERGDITPELLDLVSQFTSAQVQQEVLNAALVTGNLFGAELQSVLNALGISIPVDIFLANATGDLGSGGTPLPPGTGNGGNQGGGVGGGVTPVSVTNNFYDTPQPSAATNQIVTATSNIIRTIGSQGLQ